MPNHEQLHAAGVEFKNALDFFLKALKDEAQGISGHDPVSTPTAPAPASPPSPQAPAAGAEPPAPATA